MKKIFTLLVATAAALSMSAQVKLLFGETADTAVPVENGATYETGYVLESAKGMFYIYKQDANLWLSGSKGDYIEMEVTADGDLQVCSIDGACMLCNAANDYSVFKTGELGSNQTGAMGTPIITSALIDRTVSIRSTGEPDQETIESKMSTITAKVLLLGETEAEDVEVTVVMRNKPASEVGGVDGIVIDNPTVKPVYYNLLGHRIDKPTKGIYIVRRGNKVTKEIVRQ